MNQHLHTCEVEEDEQLAVTTLCIEGPARDYVNASGTPPATLQALYDRLKERFGLA